MVDPQFLADLQRQPEVVLQQFELSDDERALVRKAVERLGDAPVSQRAADLHAALLRRVAT